MYTTRLRHPALWLWGLWLLWLATTQAIGQCGPTPCSDPMEWEITNSLNTNHTVVNTDDFGVNITRNAAFTFTTNCGTGKPSEDANASTNPRYRIQILKVSGSGTPSFSEYTGFTTTSVCNGNLNYTGSVAAGTLVVNESFAENSPSTTVFTKTNMSPGTYWYIVRLGTNAAHSRYQALKTFTISSPCATPTGLSSSNIGETSATLDWSNATGATGYRVRWRKQGTSVWSTASPTSSTYAPSGLASSTSYEWQVRTTCSSQNSSYSTSKYFTTDTPTTPFITVTQPDGDTWYQGATYNITWSDNISENVRIDLYKDNGGTFVETLGFSIPSSGSFLWTIPSDQPQITNYKIKITSVSNASVFGWTPYFEISRMPRVKTPVAGSVWEAGINHTISWDNTGEALKIELYKGGAFHSTISSSASTGAYIWVIPANTTPANNYQVKITQLDNATITNLSGTFSIAPPCLQPTNRQETNLVHNGAILTWDAVAPATSYEVNIRAVGAPTAVPYTVTTNSLDLSGLLTASTAYDWQVKATCATGTRGNTNLRRFTTPAAPVCNTPTGLNETNVGAQRATLSWSAASGAVGYTIQLRVQGASTWVERSATGSSYSSTTLSQNTAYEWRVRSNCSGLNSAYSGIRSFSTCSLPTVSPLSPANYKGILANTPYSIRWSGTGGSGNCAIAKYWLQISNNLSTLSSQTPIDMGTATLFDFPSGSPNMGDFYWRVQAENVLGEKSAYTTTRNFTIMNLTLSPASLTFAFDEGAKNVVVTSNVFWRINSSQPWLTASLIWGTGNATVAVSCTRHTGNLARTGTLTFSNNDGISKTVTVTQHPYNCPISTSINQTADPEYYEAACYLAREGIIDLVGNEVVRPYEKIIREDLAKVAFLGAKVPNVADNFNSPFNDLASTATGDYHRYAKALSYLEYNDEVTPFDRAFNFNPGGFISRKWMLKVLLETFDVAPDNSGTSKFDDVCNDDPAYGYIKKAEAMGWIEGTSATTFEPDREALRNEVFLVLYRMLTDIRLSAPTPTAADFYTPGNTQKANLATGKGSSDGYFDFFTASGFAMPGKVPLSFGLGYNSKFKDHPTDFYPIEPLGKGFSHTYNVYLLDIPIAADNPYNKGTYLRGDTRYIIHWGGGSFYGFADNFEPTVLGVYQNLVKVNDAKFTFTTKSQITYTFEKLGTHDQAYVLTSIEDRHGNALTIQYKNGGDVSCGSKLLYTRRMIDYVKDPAGRRLDFAYYDNAHKDRYLLKQITDPVGRIISFEYLNRRLEKFMDARYHQGEHAKFMRFGYGSGKEYYLVKEIALPEGNTIQNTYSNGVLSATEIEGEANSKITIEGQRVYDHARPDDYYSVTVTNAEGFKSVSTYNKNGLVTSQQIENPSGNVLKDVNLNYGNVSHPLKPSRITSNSITGDYSYFDNGNLRKITLPEGIVHEFTYTDLNDLKTYKNPRGHTTTYHYTGKQLTSIVDPMGYTTTIVPRGDGLVSEIENPEGIRVKFDYNNYGNVAQVTLPALNIVSKASYDGVSQLKTMTNPIGQTTTFDYDGNGNLKNEKFVYNTGYTYDANGNLRSITNAMGGKTSLEYTNKDQLAKVEFQGAAKRYAYKDNGSLDYYTKPSGARLNFGYDANERLTSNGHITNISYYESGSHKNLVQTIETAHTRLSFVYDALNRLDYYTDQWGNKVDYAYDKMGNVTDITYPGGNNVHYAYNANNWLTEVTDWNSRKVRYRYYKDGRLRYIEYPNNIITSYQYDKVGRMVAVATRKQREFICGYGFKLDKLGQITQENSVEPFAAYPNLSATSDLYTYKDQDTPQQNNQLTNAGGKAVSIDVDGRTTRQGSYVFGYNAIDLLTTINNPTTGYTATFRYDGLGMRREAVRTKGGAVETTRYIIDIMGMGNVLMETDDQGKPRNYYIYGIGLLGRVKADGRTAHYYHYDYRGSTVAMTNLAGEVSHQYAYDYDGFGKVSAIKEHDANPFRYVGKYGVMHEYEALSNAKDQSQGLYFMRARFMSPTTGRFLTEDPIWHQNLYPYADNNPVNGVDPRGEFTFLVSGLISVGVGAVTAAITGQDYSVTDALVDFALGAVGAFAFSRGAALIRAGSKAKTWGGAKGWFYNRGIAKVGDGKQLHHWFFHQKQGVLGTNYLKKWAMNNPQIIHQPWNIMYINQARHTAVHRGQWWLGVPGYISFSTVAPITRELLQGDSFTPNYTPVGLSENPILIKESNNGGYVTAQVKGIKVIYTIFD